MFVSRKGTLVLALFVASRALTISAAPAAGSLLERQSGAATPGQCSANSPTTGGFFVDCAQAYRCNSDPTMGLDQCTAWSDSSCTNWVNVGCAAATTCAAEGTNGLTVATCMSNM
ncbi:MAG: hypothetical protein CYPHOPRED_004587 [Cyphobasidiales sp. Tagirdzhanova-0007]|nr:MAG: hypothetical protein CYPHOPRED_004587 [Cyphobasidiales sp. Tagirdzhanova-0007]